MKKKNNKQADDAIKRNTPAEAKWLNQPINITFLRGDLTLNQVNTMIEVVDALQTKINTALTEKQTSVFTDEDFDAQGKVVVPVPFRMMTDDPRRYAYFEGIAKSLAETSVTMERIGKDGKPYTSIKPIINEARIPKSGGGNRGVIEFILERDMIDTLFDLNRYNRYLKSIARTANSVYTSRIYQFITAYKKVGLWRPLYQDLHIMFGLSHWKTDPKTKVREWVPDKYPVYRQFKAKILKVAHDELLGLADRGEVDCYFDFKEIYPSGKTNGTPERIEFRIHTTAMGESAAQSAAHTRTLIEIEQTLRNDYNFRPSDIRQILTLVDADNAPVVLTLIAEIGQRMSKKTDGTIDDPRRYMLASLRNAILDLTPTATDASTDSDSTTPAPDNSAPLDSNLSPLTSPLSTLNPALELLDPMWHPMFQLAIDGEGREVVTVPSRSAYEAFVAAVPPATIQRFIDSLPCPLVIPKQA